MPVHQWAVLGAETNIDIALSPKGNGAITGQIADNLASGGNKRGTYATDFQTARINASDVASGVASFIGSGTSNSASGNYSAVVSGTGNDSTGSASFIGAGIYNTCAGDNASLLGGRYNTASSADSTVGGGYTNVASAIFSAVFGGQLNTASGTSSFIGGGQSNGASGNYSVISGGTGNSSFGIHSVVSGGSGNTAPGDYSVIPGGLAASTRQIYGRYSFASGNFTSSGDAQIGTNVLRLSTTDATPSILTADGNAAGSTNVSVLSDNFAYTVNATITARDTSTGDMASWIIKGAVKRGTGVATTALVGTPSIETIAQDAGASTWAVELIADTTLGAAEIRVTGEAATTIHWVCKFDTVEVG